MMLRAGALLLLSVFLIPASDANADHRRGRRYSAGVSRDPNWGWDGFNRLHYSPGYHSGRFGRRFYGGAPFYGAGCLWGTRYRYDAVVTPYGFSYYSGPALPPAYYGYGAYGVYGPGIDAPPGFSDLREPLQPPLPGQRQMQEWLDEDRDAWDAPLETLPIEELPKRFIRPSSDEAIRKRVTCNSAPSNTRLPPAATGMPLARRPTGPNPISVWESPRQGGESSIRRSGSSNSACNSTRTGRPTPSN